MSLRWSARAVTDDERAPWGALAVISALFVVLALSKSVYLPIALMVAAVPGAAFGSKRRRLTWVLATWLSAAAAAIAWTMVVVRPLQRVSPVATWMGENPLRLGGLMFNTLTTEALLSNMISGLVAPLSPTMHGPYPALWVVGAVLVGFGWLRLVDPAPRWIAPRLGIDVDDDPSPSAAATPVGDKSVDDKSVAERRLAVILAVVAAIGVYVLISYGLVYNGFGRDKHFIWGFQGRYLLPAFPLALFGANALRARPAPRRFVVWLPVAMFLLVGYWWVVLVRFFNDWLGGGSA